MPVVMPAKAAPWMRVIGMNQSMILAAGKPGSCVSPENWPENEIVKKMGITSDGTNVDGTRGISIMLRAAIARATLKEETGLVLALMVVRLQASGQRTKRYDDPNRQDR